MELYNLTCPCLSGYAFGLFQQYEYFCLGGGAYWKGGTFAMHMLIIITDPTTHVIYINSASLPTKLHTFFLNSP